MEKTVTLGPRRDEERETCSWRTTFACIRCNAVSLAPVWGFIKASPYAENNKSKWKCCPKCGGEVDTAVMRATVNHWRQDERTRHGLFNMFKSDVAILFREHLTTEWRWIEENERNTRVILVHEQDGHAPSEYRYHPWGW